MESDFVNLISDSDSCPELDDSDYRQNESIDLAEYNLPKSGKSLSAYLALFEEIKDESVAARKKPEEPPPGSSKEEMEKYYDALDDWYLEMEAEKLQQQTLESSEREANDMAMRTEYEIAEKGIIMKLFEHSYLLAHCGELKALVNYLDACTRISDSATTFDVTLSRQSVEEDWGIVLDTTTPSYSPFSNILRVEANANVQGMAKFIDRDAPASSAQLSKPTAVEQARSMPLSPFDMFLSSAQGTNSSGASQSHLNDSSLSFSFATKADSGPSSSTAGTTTSNGSLASSSSKKARRQNHSISERVNGTNSGRNQSNPTRRPKGRQTKLFAQRAISATFAAFSTPETQETQFSLDSQAHQDDAPIPFVLEAGDRITRIRNDLLHKYKLPFAIPERGSQATPASLVTQYCQETLLQPLQSLSLTVERLCLQTLSNCGTEAAAPPPWVLNADFLTHFQLFGHSHGANSLNPSDPTIFTLQLQHKWQAFSDFLHNNSNPVALYHGYSTAPSLASELFRPSSSFSEPFSAQLPSPSSQANYSELRSQDGSMSMPIVPSDQALRLALCVLLRLEKRGVLSHKLLGEIYLQGLLRRFRNLLAGLDAYYSVASLQSESQTSDGVGSTNALSIIVNSTCPFLQGLLQLQGSKLQGDKIENGTEGMNVCQRPFAARADNEGKLLAWAKSHPNPVVSFLATEAEVLRDNVFVVSASGRLCPGTFSRMSFIP